MSHRIAIVANPRRSTGADARERSLQLAFDAAGADVHLIRPEIGAHVGGQLAATAALVSGSAVPELLSWDVGPVYAALNEYAPDVVILETARAFHPRLLEGPWTVVLDFVDRLSVSYEQRADIGGGLAGLGYRALAHAHRRLEQNPPTTISHIIAAGAHCAQELGATWIPNVAPPAPKSVHSGGTIAVQRTNYGESQGSGGHDIVFFGNLSYAPNIEAVQFLDEISDDLVGLDVLIAGRNASADVRNACARNGWTLLEDFESVEHLSQLATIAVAPLRSAVGIQNKVLEAAAIGLPQLISPAAAAGLGPDSPIPTADLSPAFADRIRELLAKDRTMIENLARTFVEDNFSPAAVGHAFMAFLDGDAPPEELQTAA